VNKKKNEAHERAEHRQQQQHNRANFEEVAAQRASELEAIRERTRELRELRLAQEKRGRVRQKIEGARVAKVLHQGIFSGLAERSAKKRAKDLKPTNAQFALHSKRMLRLYQPCLPTRSLKAPTGPLWIHEITHDGFRIVARRINGVVRLQTKQGYDYAERYPLIVEATRDSRSRRSSLTARQRAGSPL
jgi:ATP-dependent DNA ligase